MYILTILKILLFDDKNGTRDFKKSLYSTRPFQSVPIRMRINTLTKKKITFYAYKVCHTKAI